MSTAWRGKVSVVKGKRIDECTSNFNVDKWHRASFSHAMAVAHARQRGLRYVAVIEEDARSDYTVEFSDSDYGEFSNLLKSPEWNFIRLGWRPHDMEKSPGGAVQARP